MSVLWAGNMTGPRFQMHVSGLFVLLLLVLLSGLTHTVFCHEDDPAPESEKLVEDSAGGEEAEDEGAGEEEEATTPSENGSETTPIPTATDATDTEEGVTEEEHGSGRSFNIDAVPPDSTIEPSSDPEVTSSLEETDWDLLFIVIPVVLVSIIIVMIVCCIFIHRRINRNTMHSEVNKEDPFLDGSSTEKVPMPMFEEDVPSVLELEMEDLDDWIKKDGELSDHNQKA